MAPEEPITPAANGNGTLESEKLEITNSPEQMSVQLQDETPPNASESETSEEEEEEEVSGSEEDEEDDKEEDDDEEPALKYERIGGSINDLLKKDTASALCIVDQKLVSRLLVNVYDVLNRLGDGHA